MNSSRVTRVDGPLVDLLMHEPAPHHAVVTIVTSSGEQLPVEVIAHAGSGRVRALALGPTEGVAVGDVARVTADVLRVPVGSACLGRLLDPLGRPLDGDGPVAAVTAPLHASCAPSLAVPRSDELRATGIRAIDLFAPLPAWGVVGVAGAAGTGKTRLLYEMMGNCHVWHEAYGVLAYVGARPCEVDDVREELSCSFMSSGESVLARATMVAATMGDPAGLRSRAVHSAVAMATHLRDTQVSDVFLLIDDTCRALEAEVSAHPGSDVETLWAALDARRRDRTPGGGRLLSIESIALPPEGFADPLVTTLVRHLDALITLVPSPASCRGVPMVDPARTTSPLLDATIVGERHMRVAAEARASLQRLAATERLGVSVQEQAMHSAGGPRLARARRLRLYLVQPLATFETATGMHGCWSPLHETLRDVEAILAGELDAVPESCLVLARGLDEIRQRAARAV